MKKNQIAQALAASIMTIGGASSVSAHDLLGGKLAKASATTGQTVDVFTTTCFAWGKQVPFNGNTSVTYGPRPTSEASGPASGFRFAVSLTSIASNPGAGGVQAIVGETSTTDVNNCTVSTFDNNCLPASPAPKSAFAYDITSGSSWNPATGSAGFANNGASLGNFGTSVYLPINKPSGFEDAELSIVITQYGGNTASVGYDFIGHCQNASTGATSSIHTGQGDWFSQSGNQVAPNQDYAQTIDQ